MMKKRFLSLMIMLCMVAALFPVSAGAVSVALSSGANHAGEWLVAKETIYDSEDLLRQTAYQYDRSGRLLKVIVKQKIDVDAFDTVQKDYTYDDAKHTLTIVDSHSFKEEWECDDQMRPIKGVSVAPGETGNWTKEYDSDGRLTAAKVDWIGEGDEGRHTELQYFYDSAGNLIREDTVVDTPYGPLPMNRTVYQIEAVDQNGNAVRYRFDDTELGAGRLLVEYVYIPAEGESPAAAFQDVKTGSYYYDSVVWAVEHTPQITNGIDASHFAPNASCTRAQMVTFLWRAAGEPTPKTANHPFRDVKSSDYFYKAVLWAVEKDITSGTGKDTFSPNATVTRAQTVTFLWRMANQPNVSAKNPFTDVASDQYYAKAVLWAVKNGITNGTSATKFSPSAACSRAQIVTFLYRAMK